MMVMKMDSWIATCGSYQILLIGENKINKNIPKLCHLENKSRNDVI